MPLITLFSEKTHGIVKKQTVRKLSKREFRCFFCDMLRTDIPVPMTRIKTRKAKRFLDVPRPFYRFAGVVFFVFLLLF